MDIGNNKNKIIDRNLLKETKDIRKKRSIAAGSWDDKGIC